MAKRKLPQGDRAVLADHLRRFTPTDWVALLLVVVTIIVAVCQLMTFDKFAPLVKSYYLPLNGASPLIAAFIVTAEVFCLPYLLGISLSRPARLISAALGFVNGLIWAYLGFWISSQPNQLRSSGLLGTLVTLVPGPWMIVYGLGFSALFMLVVIVREGRTETVVRRSKPSPR